MLTEIDRLRSIIEHTNDAIIAKDLNGTITDWNPAAERLFGFVSLEAIGKHISIIAPPDRPDEMPAILEKIKMGGRLDHFRTIRKHKDGHLVTVSLTVSPIRASDGRIVGAAKIVRDATAFMEEYERTRGLLAANAQLLLEVNHRVGNNLTIIMALMRQGLREFDGPDTQRFINETIAEIWKMADAHTKWSDKVADVGTDR